MLDPKLLRDNFQQVKEALNTRALPEDFNSWPELDLEKRKVQKEFEEIRAKKNSLNPEISNAKKSGKDISALLKSLKDLGEREKELESEISRLTTKIQNIEFLIPNIAHSSVPVGKSELENREEKKWGEIRRFSFSPKEHWEIGEKLGILDFETASKISGSRFVVYRGLGARLERAIISFMLDWHITNGYTEILPPLLVRRETMFGAGQLPKFESDLFKTTADNEFFLIPTAEVVLCNLSADQILDESELPFKYVSFTPCFRAEAGSYGKDVRGLIRMHQFHKVELVKICTPETSYQELDKLVLDAEGILEALGLPYRRITLCSGDMGLCAAKTYDLEVWLPGQNTYREISSCSNTETFQSRRTKTRFRKTKESKPELVHMLNGSGLAVGRTLVSILENYQNEDGSVNIPDPLVPYMGGIRVLK